MKFPFSALKRPKNLLVLLSIGFWSLFSQLPHWLLVQVGRVLATATRYLARHRCAVVRRNLELCFPELSPEQREQLLRKNLFHTAMGGLETGMVWFWPKARIRPMGRIFGLENLTSLEGGALLLSLHNTTVDTAGAVVNPRVELTDMMYRPHNNPVFEYFQVHGRQRHNPESRCIDRADIRGAVKAMRQGRWLWYAPDQDYGRKLSVFARFFGVEAASVNATGRLARMAKVPVVPMAHYRDEKNRWCVDIQPPLEGFPTGDDLQDAQLINDWVEAEVRKRPEQYLWVHRRFKSRPDGEPDLYGKEGKAARRAKSRKKKK